MHSGKLLATVGNSKFYESDLNINLSGNKDSTAIRAQLIKNWVKQQLIFRKAMEDLSDSEKDKDKELKDYYESLINYEYLEKASANDTDTIVNYNQMLQYYHENQKNFELKRNIIRLLYVKIPVSNESDTKAKEWMQHPNRRNMAFLKIYAKKHADNCSFDTTKWLYFSEVTKEIPLLLNYNPERFIKMNKFVELRDKQFDYLINIIDGRIVEDTAPFEMVKSKIRNIIINGRRTEEIRDIENRVFRDGESRNLFEIFTDKTNTR